MAAAPPPAEFGATLAFYAASRRASPRRDRTPRLPWK
eukprot:gene18768-22911_t